MLSAGCLFCLYVFSLKTSATYSRMLVGFLCKETVNLWIHLLLYREAKEGRMEEKI